MHLRQATLHRETQKPVHADLPGAFILRHAEPVEKQRAGGRKRLEYSGKRRTIPEGG